MVTRKVVDQVADYIKYGGATATGLYVRHSEHSEVVTTAKTVFSIGYRFVPGSTIVWIDNRRQYRQTPSTYASGIWNFVENPTHDSITTKLPIGPGAEVFIEYIGRR